MIGGYPGATYPGEYLFATPLVAAIGVAPGIDGGTSPAVDTTGATFIVISVSSYSAAAVPVVSDSKANVYTPLTARVQGTTRHQLFYCTTPTVGPGHTFTVVALGAGTALLVYAFSGPRRSFQVESGAGFGTGTTLPTGSLTPISDGALIVTGSCGLNLVTDTITPAAFARATVPRLVGTVMQGSAAWLVQPTAAPINPTWAFSPAQQDDVAGTAVFISSIAAARVTQTAVEVLNANPLLGDLHVTQRATETLSQNLGTTARVTTDTLEVLSQNTLDSTVRVTQRVVEVLSPTPPAEGRVTQALVEVLAPTPPQLGSVTQVAAEVFTATAARTRTSQLVLEVFTPVAIATRATQHAVEVFAAQPAAARVTQALVELWLIIPPCVSGEFPIDPGSSTSCDDALALDDAGAGGSCPAPILP